MSHRRTKRIFGNTFIHKLKNPNDAPRDVMTAEYLYLRKNPKKAFAFRGILKAERFYLQRHTLYPEHFNPLLVGRLEATSKGTIIFVRYQLPGGVLFIVVLSTLIFLITLMVFLFFQKNMVHSLLAILFYGGGYAVMLLNFRQKVSISQKALEKVIFRGK